jgi:hypothetical protein
MTAESQVQARPSSSRFAAAARRALSAGALAAVAVLLTWQSTAPEGAAERLEKGYPSSSQASTIIRALRRSFEKSAIARANSQSGLLQWSNEMDDGAGMRGQQHGSTRDVGFACDPDDPACTFQTAGDHHGWSRGHWVSNLKPAERSFSVRIRNDYRRLHSLATSLAVQRSSSDIIHSFGFDRKHLKAFVAVTPCCDGTFSAVVRLFSFLLGLSDDWQHLAGVRRSRMT